MDIRDPRSLSRAAKEALRVGCNPKQVILVYALALTALSVVSVLLDYLLEAQVDGATGLGNMGINSMLSTARSVVPVAQMAVSSCLGLGYLWAMLRISRKLYADGKELKKGFERLGPLVRYLLLQLGLFMALAFLLIMPVSMVFSLTPWAETIYQLEPILSDPAVYTDPTLGAQVLQAVLPMLLFFAVAYMAVLIPVQFRLRMSLYLLADDPRIGALEAMRTSARMMRGNCLKLLKVDLHLWWWHGLNLLVSLLLYLDLLLPLLGIELPLSTEGMSLVSLGVFLAGQFALLYFLRNRTELTYAAAYETLRPKPQSETGIVLGNIFQL